MKKKILDVMIDFETFGRQPNSVPINLAAVAWNRYAEENPFVISGAKDLNEKPERNEKCPGVLPFSEVYMRQSRFFFESFDVCAGLLCGLTIEKETQEWWMSQDDKVKSELFFSYRKECHPKILLEHFVEWILTLRKDMGVDDVCIWSQGSDFDIAKLRYLLKRFEIFNSVPESADVLKHTLFRDARTVILELGAKLYDGKRSFSVEQEGGLMVIDGKPNEADELNDFSCIYDRIFPLKEWGKLLKRDDEFVTSSEGVMSNYLLLCVLNGAAHNSVYDCMRSIYNVWWLNKAIDTQLI